MRTLRLESVLSLDLIQRVSPSSITKDIAQKHTEPLVTPSNPCLPLTVRLVPLGALSLTSSVAVLLLAACVHWRV